MEEEGGEESAEFSLFFGKESGRRQIPNGGQVESEETWERQEHDWEWLGLLK